MNKAEVQELLEHIGFTKSETSVYLALLDLGSTTTGPIIKKAAIPQGKVYAILDKLLNKGVVSYTTKRGTKYFQAKEPNTILNWFEKVEQNILDKKQKLIKLLPELQAKYESQPYEKQVEIYEGFNGMKTIYNLLLEKKKDLWIIGTTSTIPEIVEHYFLNWHKQRIKEHISAKLIYSKERMKIASDRKKMSYTQVRYLDLGISPSWTTITEDYVITVTMINEKNITCFLIKDKTVAQAQREYFENLWKQAKT